MDQIVQSNARDRADIFTEAARNLPNRSPELIEKDFWVVWTLHTIFSLGNLPAGLIFKGGTSLSKVFKAIDRFSEDVDLSFDRAALGFTGDRDPAHASSGKKRNRQLNELRDACQQMIREHFSPTLISAFAERLKTDREPETWDLINDPGDADGQTLIFRYPKGVNRRAGLPAYMRPTVRLEMGARGEQWPAVTAQISPYAFEALPQLSIWKNPSCTVKALAAERTFWEKATILHKWHHCPAEKQISERQSRHYYDVAKVFESDVGRNAMGDLELLRRVAAHQQTFFFAGWAKYEEAVPGTLRLVPPPERVAELRKDYEEMRRQFIFGHAPEFDDLIKVLAEVEKHVNQHA